MHFIVVVEKAVYEALQKGSDTEHYCRCLVTTFDSIHVGEKVFEELSVVLFEGVITSNDKKQKRIQEAKSKSRGNFVIENFRDCMLKISESQECKELNITLEKSDKQIAPEDKRPKDGADSIVESDFKKNIDDDKEYESKGDTFQKIVYYIGGD